MLKSRRSKIFSSQSNVKKYPKLISFVSISDTIVAINGLRTQTVEDCGHALENAVNDVIVVTTYNIFRRVKTTFVTSSSLKGHQHEQSLKHMNAMYEMGDEVSALLFFH